MELQSEIYQNRRRRKLSQAELAEHLGVSEGIVNQWEQGEKLPDVENLIDLSNFFEISLDQLVRGKEYSGFNEITNQHSLTVWDFLARYWWLIFALGGFLFWMFSRFS
ncbi:helix-turn-helix domain-containing protein [Pediococcus siamensis]|uniref:helix-turn-helix domain-containing protein n=1 Tax=Pediococcus siamensis TaxID=381829 RepID=UPI00399FF6DD